MLTRCYSDAFPKKYQSYIGCQVCNEWLNFQNFAGFYYEYTYKEPHWQIDKDIIQKGNKIYAPDKCAFVPPEINKLFVRRELHRGNTLQGVHYEKSRKRYKASMHDGSGRTKFLGRFLTVEEAFHAYKEAKETRIREIAEDYKSRISPILYEAMLNYKIEITD